MKDIQYCYCLVPEPFQLLLKNAKAYATVSLIIAVRFQTGHRPMHGKAPDDYTHYLENWSMLIKFMLVHRHTLKRFTQ